MSRAYKILPPYTYTDYIKWEGKWELIEGIPHAMSPMPGLRHQDVAGNIYLLFRQALQQSHCDCKAFLPLDYKIAEDTVVQPDVLVVCNPDLDLKNLEKPPVLVVEVLSPSTALKDRNTKYQLYQAEKIPYYLMIDLEKETIEVYSIADGLYQRVELNDNYLFTFHLTENCKMEVDLHQVWA